MMEMRGEVDIQPEKDGLADEIRDNLPTFAFKKDNFKNSDDEEKMECRICFCEFNEDDLMRQLQCFHHYHKQCIDKWFEHSDKCPLCKSEQKAGE